MLSEREKHGVAELLTKMSLADLASLCQTVTSRLLVPENDTEAIQAIILHTDKASDLLKRRKIKKELLFKYLHHKRVPIESIADKNVHISRVLEVWGSAEGGPDGAWLVPEWENSLEGPPPAPVPSRNASHTSLCSLDSRLGEAGAGVALASQLRRSGSSTSVMNFDENSCSAFSEPEPGPASGAGGSGLGNGSGALTITQCQEMAVSFVRWYCNLLNSSVDSLDSTDWGPSNFWPDASAKVSLLSGAGEVQESREAGGSEEAASMIIGVFRQHGLHCNPNLCQEGVRGRLSPHGLVMVVACGTLHTQQTACGVFEQVFGLIRDPGAENNWKIKQTEARLVGGAELPAPQVTTSRLAALTFC